MSIAQNHILVTKNLSVGYGKGKNTSIVLNEINVSIAKGELVCFLGPNGVGKSTLLRTISGVQKPLNGEVILANRPLTTYSLTERAKQLSLVLTEKIIGGNLTVKELITLGRHPHTNWSGRLTPDDHSRIEEAVTLTHIEDLANRKLYTLSDGQLQKTMIARALAQDSKIMILDEPTAHLDLKNRFEIMNLLREMTRSTNKAILIATHELDLSLQTADRLWLAAFEQSFYTGIPEDLALSGMIEKTFFGKEIDYDILTGRFSLPQSNSQTIRLSGHEPERRWTQYALQRVGHRVSKHEGSVHVHVSKQQEAATWEITHGRSGVQVFSIEELLDVVQKQIKL